MSAPTILLLRKLGYLKFERRRYQGGRTAWTIDIDELIRFDQTYVGCWKLAKELGVQPQWLLKKLVDAGAPSIVSGYARVSPVLPRADLPDTLQRILTDVTA